MEINSMPKDNWRVVPYRYRRCAIQQWKLFRWKTIYVVDNWQVAIDMVHKLNNGVDSSQIAS